MRIFYFLLICNFLPHLVLGQDFNGVIVDEFKESVVGAYVTHPASDFHTHSDGLGKFVIRDVQIGDTLEVMHLGHETINFIVEEIGNEVSIELTASAFNLGEIVVGQNIKKVNIIAAIDLKAKPVQSSQAFLRSVPGLFIGQHAGGGKAEQIFLRGFDIDHGTDVQISVDGMPVNMVSHAHGQGYADLHFLIPETIDVIDYGKGPYYSDKGNFSTAGYVQFKTKDKLENSQIEIESGRFNLFRTIGMLKLLDTEKHNAYIASEFMFSDGPFESSQNFIRNNILVKYSGELENSSRLTALVSRFSSKWDASGQIPQRLVNQKMISRFGAVDDTEGGETGRTNLALTYSQPLDDNTFMKSNIYYSLYDFELYSNFTFFLNDPINGDQIRQKEERQILGFETVWNRSTFLKNTSTFLQLGLGFRSDLIEGNELSKTVNRKTTLFNYQLGDVDEKNIYAFANTDFDVEDWLFQPAVRLDYFKFNYVNALDSVYNNKSQSKAILSPKFNIIYNLNNNIQLYLKTGLGFHSNDARVILEQDNKSIIPAAYGADLGAIIKPVPRLFTNIALWYLELEQEFVYVGDEGVVEPSGRSRRLGLDLGFRYQLSNWIFANGDINYAFARSIESSGENNFIPLAPVVTATSGLTFNKKNLNVGLQMRYLRDRPANEDNSIVAKGYYIVDLNANYTFSKITLGFLIENLLNQEWNETQFATETRLQFEQESVEEIHFTPGAPFFLKASLKYKF